MYKWTQLIPQNPSGAGREVGPPTASIKKYGDLVFSKAVYQSLGEPSKVEVHHDFDNLAVKLTPTTEENSSGFRVSVATNYKIRIKKAITECPELVGRCEVITQKGSIIIQRGRCSENP